MILSGRTSILAALAVVTAVACRASDGDGASGGGMLAAGPIALGAERSLPIPAGESGRRATRFAGAPGAPGSGGLLVFRSDEPAPERGHPVYVTPVTTTGAMIAPAGLPLFDAPAGSDVALDFDGERFVVMTSAPGLALRRVAPDGALLDDAPRALDVPQLTNAAIAWSGSMHLVAWAADRGGERVVRAARFDRDLTPLPGPPIELGSASPGMSALRVGAARDVGLVAWVARASTAPTEGTEPGDETIRRVAPDGSVADVSLPALRGRSYAVAIAAGAREFLVARQAAAGASSRVEVQRIDDAGEAVDATPLVLDEGERDAHGSAMGDGDVTASFDGSRWLVTWTHPGAPSEVRVAYVDVGRNGALDASVAGASVPAMADGKHAAIGLGADGAMIVARNVARGLSAIALDASLRPTATALVGARPSLQDVQAVGANEDGFLVVYADDRVSPSLPMVSRRLFAQHLGADGTARSAPFELGDDYSPSSELAIASDGRDYLVVEDVRSELRARRVGGGGVLDATPIRLASDGERASNAAVVHDGEAYAAIWLSASGKLLRMRVGSDGALVDRSPTALTSDAGDVDATELATVRAAARSGALVVAWQEPCRADCGSGLHALRLVGDGPAEPLDLGARHRSATLGVAAGDEHVLVTTDEEAFFVPRAGAPRAVEAWTGPAGHVLLFDGASFLDFRREGLSAAFERTWTVRHVDPRTGAATAALTVAAGPGDDEGTALHVAGGGRGRSLVAYAPVENGAHAPGVRVRVLTTNEDDPGAPRSGIDLEQGPLPPGRALPRVEESSAEATCSARPGARGLSEAAAGAALLAAAAVARRRRRPRRS